MVTTTTPITSAAATKTATKSTDAASTTLNTDYQSFLKLLTTQMKNQDPSSPVDSTQFVSQLAQFSSVEQQIKTNTTLSSLLDSFNANGLDRYSNLIGAKVEAPVGRLKTTVDGATADFRYISDTDGDATRIEIRNAAGTAVRNINVAQASSLTLQHWDGRTDDGKAAPAGNYNIVTVNSKAKQPISETPAVTAAGVAAVRNDGQGNTVVITDQGDSVPVNNISGIIAKPASVSDAAGNAYSAAQQLLSNLAG